MDLVVLQDWKYPITNVGPLYVPDDAVGRHNASPYQFPSPKQPGVYTPIALVEGYNSLIWKESFRTSGTFELKTYDIEATLTKLPKGTLVSLMDTDEVYIVTTRHISTDDDGMDVLTIGGLSVLSFTLENRLTWAYTTESPAVRATNVNIVFKIPDHLSFVLWGGLVFPHAEGGYPNKPFELPPDEIPVPHTAISQSVLDKDEWYKTEWPPPLETRLVSTSGLLELSQKYGVRTIRPKGKTALIYRPNLASLRGEGGTTLTNNIDKMLFDIYQGVDRTLENDNRIVFRYDSGDIKSSEYLDSIEEHKNVVNSHAEVDPTKTGTGMTPNLMPPVVSRLIKGSPATDAQGNPIFSSLTAPLPPGGLNYRMGEFASSAKVRDFGLKQETEARLREDGFKFLKENKEIELLTAEISPNTQYKYKDHYDLGDIVYVKGKYGSLQKMVIAEYTRTSDTSGESGYPTLMRWEEPK